MFKEYFKTNKAIKSFFILAKIENCTYFGNFGFDKEYASQITFFTKNKIIVSPHKIFALPSNKAVSIFLKENNETQKINIKKDDCVQHFFKKVLYAFKKKNFNGFYNDLINDAIIRNKIN